MYEQTITNPLGITYYQWMIRETVRVIREMDALWASLDELQPREEFDRRLYRYNELADFLDRLEENPVQEFYKCLTNAELGLKSALKQISAIEPTEEAQHGNDGQG